MDTPTHHSLSPEHADTSPEQTSLPIRNPLRRLWNDYANGFRKPITRIELRDAVVQSVLLNMLATGVTLALHPLTSRFGLGLSKRVEDYPNARNDIVWSDNLLYSIVAAPILEETLLRALPACFISDPSNKAWKIGWSTSAAFAVMHNFHIIIPDGVEFNRHYLPIPQFVGGLIYWNLERTYGVRATIMAHASWNAIFSLFDLGRSAARRFITPK